VSCLNLYEPRNPRVLGAPGQFLRNVNLAALAEPAANAPASAAVSANSLQYVLHRKIGDQIEFPRGGAIRLAAVLADTVFQRELIVSEENFMRLFAGHTGYRVFLIRAPREKLEKVTAQLEESLADYGFDVVSTADQLAAFHRVENTYLSTFQTLGALGLLLGTAGLAVVLLRNALERRRELALLRAAGYRKYQLGVMILAENILLLILGLASGTATALIAIVPAFLGRGGHLSPGSVLRLVLIVLITGVLSSLAATLAALRAPLLTSLRTE
jgi:ABC-type antimicrobial peptide transport system permease subunit